MKKLKQFKINHLGEFDKLDDICTIIGFISIISFIIGIIFGIIPGAVLYLYSYLYIDGGNLYVKFLNFAKIIDFSSLCIFIICLIVTEVFNCSYDTTFMTKYINSISANNYIYIKLKLVDFVKNADDFGSTGINIKKIPSNIATLIRSSLIPLIQNLYRISIPYKATMKEYFNHIDDLTLLYNSLKNACDVLNGTVSSSKKEKEAVEQELINSVSDIVVYINNIYKDVEEVYEKEKMKQEIKNSNSFVLEQQYHSDNFLKIKMLNKLNKGEQ